MEDNSSSTNTKLLLTLLGIVIATIAGAGPYFLQTQATIDKNMAVMVALQQKSEKDFEKLESRVTGIENALPSLIASQDGK